MPITDDRAHVGRPSKKEIALRPDNRCPALNEKTGEQCKNPLGYQTDHPGVGKCKMHGGTTPHLHMVASTSDLDQCVQEYINDPAIFDLRKDLATLRMLRDITIEEIKTTGPNTDERDKSVYKLSIIISNIVRSSEKFFSLLKQQNFALSVAQAVQIRDAMKKILIEETTTLEGVVRQALPESEALDRMAEWKVRVASRFDTELEVQSDVEVM